VAPIVALLLSLRHRRARFAAYVFLSIDIIRCVRHASWAWFAVSVSVLVAAASPVLALPGTEQSGYLANLAVMVGFALLAPLTVKGLRWVFVKPAEKLLGIPGRVATPRSRADLSGGRGGSERARVVSRKPTGRTRGHPAGGRARREALHSPRLPSLAPGE